MPLVEPVTSETLPASGREPPHPALLSWIFMAVLSLGIQRLRCHLGRTLPGWRRFTEMPFGFQNHTLALLRLWCHCGAAIGYVATHDRPGHDHGNASGPVLPCGRARAQLHARRRRVQRHAAVADAGHQAARGRTRRRPVPPRAARRAIDRARPAHAPAAQAMLRGRDRRARRWPHPSRAAKSARSGSR